MYLQDFVSRAEVAKKDYILKCVSILQFSIG